MRTITSAVCNSIKGFQFGRVPFADLLPEQAVSSPLHSFSTPCTLTQPPCSNKIPGQKKQKTGQKTGTSTKSGHKKGHPQKETGGDTETGTSTNTETGTSTNTETGTSTKKRTNQMGETGGNGDIHKRTDGKSANQGHPFKTGNRGIHVL